MPKFKSLENWNFNLQYQFLNLKFQLVVDKKYLNMPYFLFDDPFFGMLYKC